MADVKEGKLTSEFNLTKLVMYVGAALEVGSFALLKLTELGVHSPWVASVGLVLGGAMQVVVALGYQTSRQKLKSDAEHAGALAAATIADRQAALEALKK